MNDDIMGLTRLDKVMAFLSAVFTVLVLMAAGAFLMHSYGSVLKPLPQGAPDLVCYSMPQSDLKSWKRINEADRHLISEKVRRGKAQFREEWSLKCRMYSGDDIGEIMAKEQWYRDRR